MLVDGQGIIKLSNFEYACQYSFADNILEAPVVFAPVLAPVPSRWNPPDFFTGATNAGPSNPTLFADLWSVGCMLVAVSCPVRPDRFIYLIFHRSQTTRYLTQNVISLEQLPK